GENPKATSQVKVHYRGRKIDGSVFDQSYEGDAPAESDQPIEFGLNQVIKGWTEGLQLMKPGAHYRLFIPSDLAYGANAPPSIGAHQVLVFEVYLLSAE
ncbi:MAG: FKBP-type peptidyl-prolyl cis-trans isomerase, partial [Planctomycetaceae bacterium]|nr:FKBP-type peptidyl-prolyl cis-trans isomerase [Planctomycetaceae bacterium]